MPRLVTRLEMLLGAGTIAAGPSAAAFLGAPPPKGSAPLVLSPTDAGEVERILSVSVESETPVFIAGSSARGLDWNKLPQGRSLVLDLTRMDALLAVDEKSMMVTVQAGISCAALERLLVKRGLSLGFGLSGFAERVSVGGLVATGIPPLASPARGNFAGHVVNVGFALPDGTRVRTRITPRAATGPDLDALVMGTRGVLGVITDVTLRIHRVSEEQALLGFGFRTVAEAVVTLAEIVAAGLPPTSAGIWPAGARGARLAAQYSGGEAWTRASASAAKKAFKDLGARPDPKPDQSWFAHADAAAARLHGENEPIWAYGSWQALANAARAPALSQEGADFGLPSFDGRGGYAVAAAGEGAGSRIGVLQEAGCRILSAGKAVPVPFDEPARQVLATLKARFDPKNLLNPGVLHG